MSHLLKVLCRIFLNCLNHCLWPTGSVSLFLVVLLYEGHFWAVLKQHTVEVKTLHEGRLWTPCIQEEGCCLQSPLNRIVCYRIKLYGILYCIISYHTASYRTVLFRIIWNRKESYRMVLHHIVSHCIISNHIKSYGILWYRIMSCSLISTPTDCCLLWLNWPLCEGMPLLKACKIWIFFFRLIHLCSLHKKV